VKASGIDATTRLRTRLMAATWCAEAVVISVCAVTAFRLSGGDWSVAAPLLTVAALETTRVPLSSYATRLKLLARLTAFAALAGIGVLTGEVMTLGFEMLIAGRVAAVTEARADLGAARDAAADRKDAISQAAASLAAARASLASLAAERPVLADVKSQTCATKRGRSQDCTPSAAIRANAAAVAGYNTRLKRAQDEAATAQKRLDALPDGKQVQTALRASESRYRAAIAASPMTRLAAEIFGVDPAGLTDRQFERFKGIVAVSLGAAAAFTTALLAFLAHTQPRGAQSKLARALRGLAARWRRRLVVRRDVPGPVEFRDRVKFVHVPVDRTTGLILDPDAKP
jgi:hypothetical protein